MVGPIIQGVPEKFYTPMTYTVWRSMIATGTCNAGTAILSELWICPIKLIMNYLGTNNNIENHAKIQMLQLYLSGWTIEINLSKWMPATVHKAMGCPKSWK